MFCTDAVYSMVIRDHVVLDHHQLIREFIGTTIHDRAHQFIGNAVIGNGGAETGT